MRRSCTICVFSALVLAAATTSAAETTLLEAENAHPKGQSADVKKAQAEVGGAQAVATPASQAGQSCEARSAGAALAWKACPVALLREQLQSRQGGYGYGGGYGSEAKPSKKKAQAMISVKRATPRAKGDLPYSESSYESPAVIAARKDVVPTAAELRKHYWLRGCKTVLNKSISVKDAVLNNGRRGVPHLTNTCTRKVFPSPPVP